MSSRQTPLERAFAMAREGACNDVSHLIQRLNQEGYDSRQIEGRQVKKQLADLIKGSRRLWTAGVSDPRRESTPNRALGGCRETL